MANGNTPVSFFARVAQSPDRASSIFFEPFETRFLDALSEEGVDLNAFLNHWRQAMNDDLARLEALPCDGDFAHFHGVLHRLSGAVALVGAHSLMDALRRASLSPPEQGAAAIGALTARARILIAQLEATARAFRSSSQ